MTKQSVTIMVNASNVLEAEQKRQGIQAVVDQLGENESYLIELGQPGVAESWKNRLMGLMNNPLFKTFASKI